MSQIILAARCSSRLVVDLEDKGSLHSKSGALSIHGELDDLLVDVGGASKGKTFALVVGLARSCVQRVQVEGAHVAWRLPSVLEPECKFAGELKDAQTLSLDA